MNKLLQVSDLSFSYGGPMIFEHIDFELGEGEICCLMGLNGCGKSTLIDCILGVNEPGSGEIFVKGKSLSEYKPAQLARLLSYVPQVHDSSFPYLVKDIVLMGRTAYQRGLSSPDENDRALCRKAMENCGIAHLAERPYTHISGGEMQMVMLTRALVQETPVILMDEPTAHLDFRNEQVFLETLVRLIREKNISVLLATHSPNQAFYFENEGLNTQVLLMDRGAIRAAGRAREVLSEENLRSIYDMDVRVADIDLDQDGVLRRIIPIRMRKGEENEI